MKTSYVFLADGFEEIEALTSVDIMRRAGMDVVTVSINDTVAVTGAHGIKVEADEVFADEKRYLGAEWLVLPGGMPGATNPASYGELTQLLCVQNENCGKIAAICASPAVVLAPLGLLNGKRGVCYPGFDDMMAGCDVQSVPVVVDGNVVTGNGPAAAGAFALQIVSISMGEDVAKGVSDGMLLTK